jgi:multidrug efflux system membrane fusion protein
MAPVAALGSNQMGKYVYVVGKGDKAELRPLQLGPGDGTLVSVVRGVSEGEQVITGNLQKIGPGSPVVASPQPKGARP